MNKILSRNGLSGAFYFVLLFLLWTIVGTVILILEEDRQVYLFVNSKNNPFLDTILPFVSHLGTFPVIALCLLAVLCIPRFRTKKVLLSMILCNTVPFLLIQLLKNIINAPRPLNYFKNAEWIHRVSGQPENYHLSFPSGHSGGAFALYCFLSLLLPEKWSWLGVPFFLAALLTGYSRIYLSQHFFADVFAGSLIGVLSVLFIFKMIRPLPSQAPAQ